MAVAAIRSDSGAACAEVCAKVLTVRGGAHATSRIEQRNTLAAAFTDTSSVVLVSSLLPTDDAKIVAPAAAPRSNNPHATIRPAPDWIISCFDGILSNLM